MQAMTEFPGRSRLVFDVGLVCDDPAGLIPEFQDRSQELQPPDVHHALPRFLPVINLRVNFGT